MKREISPVTIAGVLAISVVVFMAAVITWQVLRAQSVDDARRHDSQVSTCIIRQQARGLGIAVRALRGEPGDPHRNAQLTDASDVLAGLEHVNRVCG